jgi:hypothetical protein
VPRTATLEELFFRMTEGALADGQAPPPEQERGAADDAGSSEPAAVSA